MAVLGFVYTGIRQHHIGGIDVLIWLALGLQGYFLFRRTVVQMAGAVDSNRALFTYRQVTPVDTVLMRGVLEGVIMFAIIMVIFSGMALLGHDVVPLDPLGMIAALFGLWLFGVAVGLNVSVLSELVPETRQIVNIIMMPLYFISGVMVPISGIPEPYRDWLLINPIVHGLDAAREGFSPYYHSVPNLSLSYLYSVALVGITIGLMLHRRFADFVVTR